MSRDVLAGEQITDADLQVVSMSSDDDIPTVPASQRSTIVGQYARVRLLSGSLLAADSVQPRPIVDPERVLMSVVVPVGLVPVGLREQSRVVLVVTPPTSGGVRPPPVLVEAVVASVPRNLGEVVGSADAGQGMVALAVEVPPRVRRSRRRGRGGERRRARRIGAVPRRPGRGRRRADRTAVTRRASGVPGSDGCRALPSRRRTSTDRRRSRRTTTRTARMTIVAVCCGRRIGGHDDDSRVALGDVAGRLSDAARRV